MGMWASYWHKNIHLSCNKSNLISKMRNSNYLQQEFQPLKGYTRASVFNLCGVSITSHRIVIYALLPQTPVELNRSCRSEHPLWLCNYLFQVLNDLANNLLLAHHPFAGNFLLFSGFVITLKVLYIKQNECCKGCSSDAIN